MAVLTVINTQVIWDKVKELNAEADKHATEARIYSAMADELTDLAVSLEKKNDSEDPLPIPEASDE